jgi:hypothetical protein
MATGSAVSISRISENSLALVVSGLGIAQTQSRIAIKDRCCFYLIQEYLVHALAGYHLNCPNR